jgi:hypothetical protein
LATQILDHQMTDRITKTNNKSRTLVCFHGGVVWPVEFTTGILRGPVGGFGCFSGLPLAKGTQQNIPHSDQGEGCGHEEIEQAGGPKPAKKWLRLHVGHARNYTQEEKKENDNDKLR